MSGFCSKIIGKPLKAIKKRALGFRRKAFLTGLAGFIFAVLCVIAFNATLEATSAPQYCATCHEMEAAYQTWKLSEHGTGRMGTSVGCVECHLPPKEKYFTYVAAKGCCGAKSVYKHYFGGEYAPEPIRKKVLERMLDETCVNCHNNLLAKPSSPAARVAHTASLARPDSPEAGCMACHEYTGHKRKEKADIKDTTGDEGRD